MRNSVNSPYKSYIEEKCQISMSIYFFKKLKIKILIDVYYKAIDSLQETSITILLKTTQKY